MLSIFNSPYPLFNDRKNWYIIALITLFFVPTFLIFFKPFGTTEDVSKIFLSGYGVIDSICILVVGILFPKAFPKIFVEEKWTVWKQILWLLCSVFLISFCNYIYLKLYFGYPISLIGFIYFIPIVMSIGSFLFATLTVLDYIRRLKVYQNSSKKINSEISQKEKNFQEIQIEITDENQKESLKIFYYEMIFIKADDNYVEVFFLQKEEIKKKVIRTTLKSIENETKNLLFRCHRTFLVNLQQVSRVSGNAQGYKLHFEKIDLAIPVSRDKGREIKQAFHQIRLS